MFAVKDVKITTSSSETYWGTSFCENGLFVLLEVEGSADKPAPQKGKEFLDLLLTKITNYQERHLATLKDIAEWARKMDFLRTLTVGFLQKDVLFLSNLGIGEVRLQRDEKIGKILSAGETSSGKVSPGDRLIFSSKTFLSCIDKEGQEEILREKDLTTAGEKAYSILVVNPNSFGAIGILLEIEKQVNTSEEPVSQIAKKAENYKEIFRQKLKGIISSVGQRRLDLFDQNEETKPQKTLLTVAVILILLLIISIFLNISHTKSTGKRNNLLQTLDLVSHQYDEAVSLLDLNPTRSRVLLSDSKLSLLQVMRDFSKNSSEYKQVNEWLGKIAEKEVAAYKIYKFTSVPLFFDINLIKTGGWGAKIALYGKTAVILDTQNKTIYSLSLDTKQASIIAGNEVVKETQEVAIHGKKAYLLNSDGIIQTDLTVKSSQVAIKPDKEWGEIASVTAFAGNLYLLDRKNNAIWKYIAAESGFSARTSYLNPGVNINLGLASKVVIDGSVWVLSDRETIFKFTSGQSDNFSFKGLSDTISDVTSIFTSDEAKRLYVLDKSSQRILVFDKDGNYQEQYQWEELKNANDLVASEEEKKIFVLAGSKIYAMDIK